MFESRRRKEEIQVTFVSLLPRISSFCSWFLSFIKVHVGRREENQRETNQRKGAHDIFSPTNLQIPLTFVNCDFGFIILFLITFGLLIELWMMGEVEGWRETRKTKPSQGSQCFNDSLRQFHIYFLFRNYLLLEAHL